MKRIIQVGLWASALLLCMAGYSIPVKAVGEGGANIMISEVSPEAGDGASKESIRLYNPQDITVDASGWMLQYRSASYKADDPKGWSVRAILGCQSTRQSDCPSPSPVVIKAKAWLHLSSYETGEGIMPLAAGMATAGGVIRLVEPAEVPIVHDKVGYGSAADYEGQAPAPAPRPGQGIVRIRTDEGEVVDSDDNSTDFAVLHIDDEDTEESVEPPAAEVPGESPPPSYLGVEISELLPDPASPLTDSDDEFIELYNPHGESVNLAGYKLMTGSNWSHTYTIKELEVPAYGYAVLSSAQTNISLSNTGTGVRLYDPAGKLVFEVPNYTKAKTGYGWVRDGGGSWTWTAKPTPESQNIVELPAVSPKAAATPKKSTTKSTTAKKASTPKITAVKGAATAVPTGESQTQESNQVGMWVLIVAGTIGLSYALFEYRQEIGGFIRKRWEWFRSLGSK